MTATREDIEEWLEMGKELGATHVIIAADTFGYDNYPVYVKHMEGGHPAGGEMRSNGLSLGDVKHIYRLYHKDMQRVDEVYSLTGKHSIKSQLKEHRAKHFD
jgi:hypothetical protein